MKPLVKQLKRLKTISASSMTPTFSDTACRTLS